MIRVGYPCINRSIGCTANHTFRMASYSSRRMEETISLNLECLFRILVYNDEKGIRFFRISSDLVPFASHEICDLNWRKTFSRQFDEIGDFVKSKGMRVSMHPDQFVLLNSLREDVVKKSIAELEYHAAVLDSMGLGREAKIQIHVGGVYGDKTGAIERFVSQYALLSKEVRRRLVIENDDRLYDLSDCMKVNSATGIPVLFDVFHHECLSGGMTIKKAITQAAGTWEKSDGPPMMDYSQQAYGKRKGSHSDTVDAARFLKFAALVKKEIGQADIMMEIKDKEKSVLKVLGEINNINLPKKVFR